MLRSARYNGMLSGTCFQRYAAHCTLQRYAERRLYSGVLRAARYSGMLSGTCFQRYAAQCTLQRYAERRLYSGVLRSARYSGMLSGTCFQRYAFSDMLRSARYSGMLSGSLQRYAAVFVKAYGANKTIFRCHVVHRYMASRYSDLVVLGCWPSRCLYYACREMCVSAIDRCRV